MRIRYQFGVRGEVRAVDGDWPKLSFQRDDLQLEIERPISLLKMFVDPESLGAPINREAAPETFDGRYITRICMEIQPQGEAAARDARENYAPLVWRILNELRTWLRVLTRQYWIGYKDRPFSEDRYSVTLIDGGARTTISSAAATGIGFEYGADLDASMWASLGAKLATQEKPRASQLFFCDALLDVAEGDTRQAVVTLAVSCEQELQDLLRDIVERRPDQQMRAAFSKYARVPFQEGLKVTAVFGGTSFGDFDSEAAGLISQLYDLRGQAAHKGVIRETPPDIVKFIKAAEKFFAWADDQRSKKL